MHSESVNNIQLGFATKTRWGDAIDQGWLLLFFMFVFLLIVPFINWQRKAYRLPDF